MKLCSTAAAIRDFSGRHPRGWLGPGLTETWETPDLLVEEGFEYVCDWVFDDQPVWLRTRTSPIVNPYTQECKVKGSKDGREEPPPPFPAAQGNPG